RQASAHGCQALYLPRGDARRQGLYRRALDGVGIAGGVRREAWEDPARVLTREGWIYSYSVDIQGREAVRKITPGFRAGKDLRAARDERHRFHVPEPKLNRLVTVYALDSSKSTLAPARLAPPPTSPPALPMGGGGLLSTPAERTAARLPR